MKYASKIDIKREKQWIIYKRAVRLTRPYGLLTLEVLREHVLETEQFTVREEVGVYDVIILNIQGERLENTTELEHRIAKEEAYMRGYEAHHSKYRKES